MAKKSPKQPRESKELTERKREAATIRARRELFDKLTASFGWASAKSSRLRKEYFSRFGSGDFELERDRENLVRFCRALDSDTTIFPAIANRMTDIVIGRGIRPRAAMGSKSQEAVNLFMHWANRCDATGRMSFWKLQRMMYREKFVAGDAAMLKIKGGKLLMIEAENILTPAGRELLEGDKIITDGVEIDGTGMPLAYHVGVWNNSGSIPKQVTKRYAAENVIFLANRQRVSMTRGVPMLASAIERVAMMEETQTSVHIAQQVAAMFAMVIESNNPAQTRSMLRTATESSGGSGERVKDLAQVGPGIVMTLGMNESAKTIQGAQPHGNYDTFYRTALQSVLSVIGLPVEVGVLDNSRANYSVSRMAEIQSQNTAEPERDDFVFSVCIPVWDWFVAEAIRSGQLSGSFEEYAEITWHAPPRKLLDADVETRAATMQIQHNLRSAMDVIEEQGGNPDQVFADREKEMKDWADRGILPPVMPGSAVPTGSEKKTDSSEPPDISQPQS